MTDGPQIDDRRRFKELWKELCVRAGAAMLAGLAAGVWIEVVDSHLSHSYPLGNVLLLATPVVFLPLPSCSVKKGLTVFPYSAAALLSGIVLLVLVGELRFFGGDLSLLVTLGTAIGVVEGLLERSLATLLAGMLGGAASGALACATWSHDLSGIIGVSGHNIAIAMMAVVIVHVTIGLSLALGRGIRDLPKRKQDHAEPTE